MVSILLTKCLLRARRLSLSAAGTESVGWITWSSWMICDEFQFPIYRYDCHLLPLEQEVTVEPEKDASIEAIQKEGDRY